MLANAEGTGDRWDDSSVLGTVDRILKVSRKVVEQLADDLIAVMQVD